MKTMTIAIICSVVWASTSWAATTATGDQATDQAYEDLAVLRRKLVRMKQEMDRFVKDVTATYPDQGVAGGFGQDVRIDVVEGEKSITVKADLPGMDKDKIDIRLEEGKILKISGAREMEKRVEEPGIVRQERMSGKFERVLTLPAECKNEGITASYKNGVLEIVIPKKETPKKEEVKIAVQ